VGLMATSLYWVVTSTSSNARGQADAWPTTTVTRAGTDRGTLRTADPHGAAINGRSGKMKLDDGTGVLGSVQHGWRSRGPVTVSAGGNLGSRLPADSRCLDPATDRAWPKWPESAKAARATAWATRLFSGLATAEKPSGRGLTTSYEERLEGAGPRGVCRCVLACSRGRASEAPRSANSGWEAEQHTSRSTR